nr:hypothetical protein [Rhodococcus qingshengii]
MSSPRIRRSGSPSGGASEESSGDLIAYAEPFAQDRARVFDFAVAGEQPAGARALGGDDERLGQRRNQVGIRVGEGGVLRPPRRVTGVADHRRSRG